MAEEKSNYSYGKRPLWQWILLYVVIAGVLYGLVYYFVFAKHGYNTSMMYPTPAANSAQATAMPQATGSATSASNIYMTKTSPTKGQYLTDFNGMTLYIFDKDTNGVSNCYGGCASTWPPYTSGATAQKTFPTGISVITRTDGSKQFAYKGMPLYYYSPDQKPGDILGDGVGGVWHIVKP